MKLYKSPFLRDFWHLNVAMMTSNNALVPDADKEDSIASKPFDWPFLFNGMRMNGWQDNGIKYYLVGNAIVWWGSSASLIIWVFTLGWHLARFQRKINDFAPGASAFADVVARALLMPLPCRRVEPVLVRVEDCVRWLGFALP